jgi:Spy/CpxP family protein refolding chaperone
MESGFSMIATLVEMDLSKEQKRNLAMLMKDRETELSSAMDEVLAGRKALKEVLAMEQPDSRAIKNANALIARGNERLSLTLGEMLPKMRATLNVGQRELLTDFRDTRFKNISSRIDAFRRVVRHWVQVNAG